MLRNHKCGHADVNIMPHMLEHFAFLFGHCSVTTACRHCGCFTLCFLHIVCVWLLSSSVFVVPHCCCFTLCCFFVHIVCVYSIEKGFGSYICTCNMRTYTSILCAHTRAHLQPFEIKIVQHLINPP